MGMVDIAVSTVDDVPTDCPWVEGLARTIDPCVAVVAVPFGPAMAKVLRVVGTAARLGKPIIVLIPAGANRDKLRFSMRGAPIIGLDGDPATAADEILKSIRDLQAPEAIRNRSGTSRSRRTDWSNDLLLPTMLSATGVLTGDAVRLSERSQPPEFVVPYRMSDFTDGIVNGSGHLRFTVDDLAHDLFTTGRAPGDRMRYDAAS